MFTTLSSSKVAKVSFECCLCITSYIQKNVDFLPEFDLYAFKPQEVLLFLLTVLSLHVLRLARHLLVNQRPGWGGGSLGVWG